MLAASRKILTQATSAHMCKVIGRVPVRHFTSVDFNSPLSKLSPMDAEKELFKSKRKISLLYSQGKYSDALDAAILLEEQVTEVLGRENAAHASCLNNMALMYKTLGQYDLALTLYTDALHKYERIGGTQHISYLSTLNNLGVLYKTISAQSKGVKKTIMLERAEEALCDVYRLVGEIKGDSNKETLTAANSLASLYTLKKQWKEAEEIYRKTLDIVIDTYSEEDILAATTKNNLALMLKKQVIEEVTAEAKANSQKKNNEALKEPEKERTFTAYLSDDMSQRLDEAKKLYLECLAIRRTTLGDSHPETIVCTHNLAELLLCVGEGEAAFELHEQITQLLGGDDATTAFMKTQMNNMHANMDIPKPLKGNSDDEEDENDDEEDENDDELDIDLGGLEDEDDMVFEGTKDGHLDTPQPPNRAKTVVVPSSIPQHE